jgi:hypothetical protein
MLLIKPLKYKHLVMDRGPMGFRTYCEIFNKPEELDIAYQMYNGHTKEIYQGFKHVTNNQMEIKAAIAGLKALKKSIFQ